MWLTTKKKINTIFNYIVDIFRNNEFYTVPENSFISCIDTPFLNRQNNRTSIAQIAYNKTNKFIQYRFEDFELAFDKRVRSYYLHAQLFILLVFPGEDAFNSVNDWGAGAIKKGGCKSSYCFYKR